MTTGDNWPTGAVTFLFSDIEDSTPLWDRHRAAMRPALAEHDRILQTAVTHNGGVIVKTTGDGAMAVFSSPSAALSAALEAQHELQDSKWATIAPDKIRARMGLHTGEAELRAGDYFGTAVNRAARIMAIGHGGQVLLSTVTAGLVGELDKPFSLLDLGDVLLKGLARPEHVFQLKAADLAANFPPLRTEAAVNGNLPRQLTSFIGRARERIEVTNLLAESSLLTLTGPGGTGKTRLSLEVAGDRQDHYTHGAWLVELAPLSDPTNVPAAIAGLWDLRETPMTPLNEELVNYLRGKEMLLILDNCEHLVAACAKLAAELLAAAPRLTILASSREGLGVPGETTYHLPTLLVPGRDVIEPEALRAYESVQLFVERARSAKPGFALTSENAAAVGRVVRRLDGIPLALELAAARLKLLPPEQLAERLDDRFRLLTGGSRTALPRQQTLRALIDWSYDHLDQGEQALFRQLGVFTGGWSLEAAEAVANIEPENPRGLNQNPETDNLQSNNLAGLDVLDLLGNLINKSLVIMDDENGQAHFRFLETIRQYARDKLFEAGEGTVARDRHLDYFATRLLDDCPVSRDSERLIIMIGTFTGNIDQWTSQLKPDLDNIRAAMEWALERDPLLALAMAINLPIFFSFEGSTAESSQWLDDALQAVAGLDPATGEAAARRVSQVALGKVLQGALLFTRGQTPQALEVLQEAELLAKDQEITNALAMTYSMQGTILGVLGRPEASEHAVAAIELYKTLDDEIGQCLPMLTIARQKLNNEDFLAADSLIERVKVILAGTDYHFFKTGITNWMQYRMALQRGQLEEAHRLGWILRDNSDSRLQRNVIESEMGHLMRRSGDDETAETIYYRTLRNWYDLGNRPAVANQLEVFAFIAIHRHEFKLAALLLGAAEAMREQVGAPMLDNEREEYEIETEKLRASMASEALAAAWQEGRMLDLEKAVNLALSTGGFID